MLAVRKTPQPVIGPEFQDNQFRLKSDDCAIDPRGTTGGCFAADAGVHDAMFVPCFLEPLLQQSDPGPVNVNTIARAETVAENQDGRRLGSLGVGHH